MAESKHEQILEALVTAAQAIHSDNGATYWLTVNKAIRAPEFTQQCLNSTVTTIYCFSPDEEENEELTFTHTRSDMHVDLAVATKYSAASDDPFHQPEVDRWRLQNRLVQDAVRALRSPAQLKTWRDSGILLHLMIPIVDRSAERTFHPGWAIAFLRLVIQYEYEDAAA